MGLKNAFADIATENTSNSHLATANNQLITANEQLLQRSTSDRDLLILILEEMRLMNMHLSLITDQEITNHELDEENTR